ncbi:MAG TPA: CsbD family protein [Bryobacteraceae bacterium]|nr:CsbD family protein [Bryobacteraceae bacterium]
MKDSTKDNVKGKAHEVKGTAKKKLGRAAKNPELKEEGQAERFAGKVQKNVGDIERLWRSKVAKGLLAMTYVTSNHYHHSDTGFWRRLLWLRPLGIRWRGWRRSRHNSDHPSAGLSFGSLSLTERTSRRS